MTNARAAQLHRRLDRQFAETCVKDGTDGR
jgi:hypothetical protein